MNAEKQASPGENVSPNTSIRGPVLTGLAILLAGLGGFLVWAATAPLDEGIVTPGALMVEGNRKTIQHLDGGIVSEILVREGDFVRAGQPLFRMDRAQLLADLGVLRTQFAAAAAVEARLLAEYSGAATLTFPEELRATRGDPSVLGPMDLQRQLFETRRRALESELAIMRESIAGVEARIAGLESLQQSKLSQIRLLTEELEKLRKLYQKGFVPHNRIFDMERMLVDLTGGRDSDLARMDADRKSIAELKLRMLQTRQNFQQEVETELADVQRNVSSMREQIKAAESRLQRAESRAPEDGVVIGLRLHTVGGVVRPGEVLMDLVPRNAALVIEARVQPQERDRIRPGLSAGVRFVALNRNNTPVLEGKVILVSADRITDEKTGTPYYLVRVSVPLEALGGLEGGALEPGMPVDVIIRTGERTFLNYLLKPMTDRMARSFKEE